MGQPQRVEAPRQRDQVRESFRDAVDGIDVRELHTGQPSRVLPGPGARPQPSEPAGLRGVGAPRAPWSPVRAMAPVAPDPGTREDQALHTRVAVEAAVAPLRTEIARLRAEVARLSELPGEVSRNRRSDLLILGGLMLVAFAIAGVLMGPVFHG